MRCAGAFIIILLFQSCFFLGPLPKKRLRQAKEVAPLDVVIVPGLPLYKGKWDTLLKARILWSEFLLRKNYSKSVLYSGDAVYTQWIEGSSMALYAEQLGIEPGKILIDTTAQHSTENLMYGYRIAKEKGYTKIGVATDPFQCAMLYKYARKHIKEHIYFIPVIYDSIIDKMTVEPLIDTSLTKKKNFIPISERQNYKDRLKGTRGKNIEE